MRRLPAFLALILTLGSASRADEISDQITAAKSARLAAIQAANAGLSTAFDDACATTSAAGHLEVAAKVAAEKRAFEINGVLPKSPAMKGPLQAYLGEREAAMMALEDSYIAAISDCSKIGSTSRAAQLSGERGRLVAQEAKTVAAKLGEKIESKPVETPPRPTPDQTTHQFIAELVTRVHKRIEDVAAEPTKEARNIAHGHMIQDFDSELRTRQIVLKLQINHIEDLTGVYRFWFDPRDDSRTEGVQDATGYFEAALASRDAAAIKPGDYFTVSGRGRFLAAASNMAFNTGAIDPRANWSMLYSRFGITSGSVYAAVVFSSDVAKYDYCMAIDAFKWKLERNDAPYSPPGPTASAVTPPAPQQPVQTAVVPDPAILPAVATLAPPAQPIAPPIAPPTLNEPPPPEVSVAGIPRAKHEYPHELDTRAPSYMILKRVETQQMLETRNSRFQKWFGSAARPTMTRPDIEVGGNYCSTFWYSTLQWSIERRTIWLYHNSEIIRADLYQRELEDTAVADAIADMKNRHTKINPIYVDQQFASDPDLMFNPEYVDAVFRHDPYDTWSIPWGWLTLFVGLTGAAVVWWASTYDGIDVQVPWAYVIVFGIGVVCCIFMALK